MQIRRLQHCEELPARALIDRHSQLFAIAAEKKRVRNSIYMEFFVDLAIAVEQDRIQLRSEDLNFAGIIFEDPVRGLPPEFQRIKGEQKEYLRGTAFKKAFAQFG